ncbi:MAG: hypothetical protein A3B37_03485 [Candidatus Sungbacteria bacterium RIFCSPLOWO2_01_FULL_59_16]|uniref:Uncharacterized protein n=1 Tax=Candidatus Sungbacteria bacterium RIFCSPLOWO2_01_FULL_59_16 TaxID=1802280 RepID=A0A1G2LC93_9BACT|nr:MAG: hypothetical protein A3B37_03485 [Candidatus Sungbacteria bacterium RIFCSPLOWO2_01_FULL_59_16]
MRRIDIRRREARSTAARRSPLATSSAKPMKSRRPKPLPRARAARPRVKIGTSAPMMGSASETSVNSSAEKKKRDDAMKRMPETSARMTID